MSIDLICSNDWKGKGCLVLPEKSAMNIEEQLAEQHAKLTSLRTLISKESALWTTEETTWYGNKAIASVEKELAEVTIQLLNIELLFEKDFNDWNAKERRKYGTEEKVALEQLRKEKEQLRKEKERLQKEKERLQKEEERLREKEHELLKQQTILLQREQNQGIASLITTETSMDIDVRPFDSAVYLSRNNQYFPFFDPMIEKYLNHFGDKALLARDNVINQVNHIISKREVEKYQPIICSTSRGMGKTAFMEAVGMQLVKPHLKNQLIMDALAYGRILSFDFADAAVETAIPRQEDIRTFFPRLMIYFLCRMFAGTQVDGIHFEQTEFNNVISFIGSQNRFNSWKKACLELGADRMMDEYIRLTNLAFGVNCSSPPVFLLDEIQGLLEPTTVKSKFKDDQVVFHSFLSLLLTQLAGKYKPVCICTGTNSGNIINITEKSKIIPQFVSLSTLHKEEDYKTFWDQRTEYLNNSSNQNAELTYNDGEMLSSLVYASYQIPRLLLLAHLAWFNHKTTSHLTDRIAPLQSYENDAINYYSEMSELLLNSQFVGNDIPHILMCCGVHWEVRNINSFVPGTNILWAHLISMSVVFPYLENCYIIPFSLMWAAKTPTDLQVGDYTKTRTGIAEHCKWLIPNFDINNLYVSYDQVRQLSLFNLGALYESLFASSLAVKYYLRQLEVKTETTLPLLAVYDVAEEDENTFKALADIWVDFSSGIFLPDQEVFADSMNMANAIIHNGKSPTAHHDIIFPAKRKAQNANGLVPMNIAVSCKASFDLSNNKTIQSQQKISKRNDNPVDLLIWLYLGNEKREERYQGKVVFMNGNGCCNGLALDMVILTKKLISLNNQS